MFWAISPSPTQTHGYTHTEARDVSLNETINTRTTSLAMLQLSKTSHIHTETRQNKSLV